MGKLGVEKLREMVERLQGEVEKIRGDLKQKKRYGLVWEDKIEAVVARCERELPVLEEVKQLAISADGDAPTNLLIEGDNYHALSVLNYTHAGKIDVIYIDPPYNTGNQDFIYNDKFVDNTDAYKHSKWISFMQRRLALSKSLLKESGAIFVSIDDNEYPRLIMLMEEIFGEKNLKTICVKMSEPTGVKMSSVAATGRIPKLKEYLVIAKKGGISNLYLDKLPKGKWDAEYKTLITNASQEDIAWAKKIRDDDDRTNADASACERLIGKWETVSLAEYFKANKICKESEQQDFKYKNAWRIIRSAALTGGGRDIAVSKKQGFKVVPKFFCIITPRNKMYWIDGSFNSDAKLPRCKVLLADDYLTVHPGDFWSDIKTTGLEGEGGVSFTNGKKPLKLIERAIKTNQSKEVIVLDFFAGSGTTGEAVLRLNAEDGGNRRFVLCTYNEENGKGKVIDDFCYPRLQKAIRGNGNKKPLGGALKYFKTAFVPSDVVNPTNQDKVRLTDKAAEMLCVRDNIFEPVEINKTYRIYGDGRGRFIGIIYEQDAIANFKKAAAKHNGKFSVYVFSLSDDDCAEEFTDMRNKVKLQPIPKVILQVYQRIFGKKGPLL